jgi:hypothetical protein
MRMLYIDYKYHFDGINGELGGKTNKGEKPCIYSSISKKPCIPNKNINQG